MKLIALDVGTKRIGVAKADSNVRIAIPYSAIEVNGEEFKKIASLARAWDINNFVLGLPRNAAGEETKQSLYVRQFAKALKRAIPNAKIGFQDESLTSVEAEKRLKNRKKGYQKGDIDSEAAAIILQDFLEEKTGKSTTRAAAARRKTVKGARPKRTLTIVLTLVILLLAAGGVAFGYYTYNLRPVSEVDCGKVAADECDPTVFSIENGASVGEIATDLKEANLIRDPLVFQVYVRLNSNGEALKAGDYDLNKAMSVESITKLLLHGSADVYTLTVFPGETVRQVKARLVSVGYDEAEVDAALAKNYTGEDFGWIFEGRPEEVTSLEGYLFGETYEFFRDDTAETVVRQLLKGMAKTLKDGGFRGKFEEHGLNLYEGITLASVVQKEANNAEDMAKVAQVFYNRMGKGMTLGSDVTAIYAVDLVDPERETYTTPGAVIEIDSPYNTRKYAGLPYGPVSNPGINALNAVAAPDGTMTDTLFFLTGDDQMMYYSDTEAGHQQNIIDHCRELCNIDL